MPNPTSSQTKAQDPSNDRGSLTNATVDGKKDAALESHRKDPAFSAEEKAKEAYEAMHGGIWGLGTDEERLAKALEGLSPEQAKKVIEAYRDHYGKDLVADIQSETSGKWGSLLETLIKGQGTGSDVANLHHALLGAGTDEAKIYEILENKDAAEIKAIKDEYQKKYGKSYEEALRGELSGADLDRALALLRGDKASADAARIRQAIAGAGTTESEISSTLKGKSPEQIEAIKNAYQSLYKESLDAALKGDLSGPELDEANARLSSQSAEADAARLKTAMNSAGTDEKEIRNVLEGKSKEEREAIEAAYRKLYGRELLHDLKQELSGIELECAESLLRDGKISEAQRLRLAVTGAGTDEEAIRELLHEKSAEEVEKIRKEYRERYGEELDTRLDQELAGRDEFQTKLDLRGKAETIEERMSRLKETRDFEKSGAGGAIMDRVSGKGRQLDDAVARVNRAYKEAMQDGVVSEEERRRIETLLEYGEHDVESFVEAKKVVAETAATVAATAAATTAIVLTAGAGAVVVIGAAAAAGAVGYVGGKKLVEGNAYDTQGTVQDAAIGAVEGAITAATMGAGKAAIEAAKQGGKQVLKGAAKEIGESAIQQSSKTIISRVVQSGRQVAVEGALGGAGGDGIRAVLDGKTWENGIVNGFSNVVTAAGVGALGGIAGEMGGRVIGLGLGGVYRQGRAIVGAVGNGAPSVHMQIPDSSPAFKVADYQRPIGLPVADRVRKVTQDLGPEEQRLLSVSANRELPWEVRIEAANKIVKGRGLEVSAGTPKPLDALEFEAALLGLDVRRSPYAYRLDTRSPDEIAKHGFMPRSDKAPGSLYDHINGKSGNLVSTSATPGNQTVAMGLAAFNQAKPVGRDLVSQYRAVCLSLSENFDELVTQFRTKHPNLSPETAESLVHVNLFREVQQRFGRFSQTYEVLEYAIKDARGVHFKELKDFPYTLQDEIAIPSAAPGSVIAMRRVEITQPWGGFHPKDGPMLAGNTELSLGKWTALDGSALPRELAETLNPKTLPTPLAARPEALSAVNKLDSSIPATQFSSGYFNESEQLYKELLNSPVNAPRVIGRSSEIRLTDVDGRISREHITVTRLVNGNYKIVDGVRASSNGVFVGGERIPSYVPLQVRPGERIGIGNSSFEVPKYRADLSVDQQVLFAKLESGNRITVGRAPDSDIVIKDPRASWRHATLEKGPDGKIVVLDGVRSGNGVQVRTDLGWQKITEFEARPGQQLRLTKDFEFCLPAADRPYYREMYDTKWKLRDSPENLLENARRDANANPSMVRSKAINGLEHQVYGAGYSDASRLLSAIKAAAPEQALKFYVFDDLGEILLSNGSQRSIRALPIDQQGRVLVSRWAIEKSADVDSLVQELVWTNKSMEHAFAQKRSYTVVFEKGLEESEAFVRQVDGPALYGARPILGRDRPIIGSVNLRGTDNPGVRQIGIVVDDANVPELSQFYESFAKEKVRRIVQRTGVEQGEGEVLQAVFDKVYNTLKYTRECDEIVIKELGIEAMPMPRGAFPKINIHSYVKRGVGVCEHQALLAEYLLEKLKRDGLLGWDVKISHERNLLGGNAAHSWARVRLSDGSIWVVDPARKFVGPIFRNQSWIYGREEDYLRAEAIPI